MTTLDEVLADLPEDRQAAIAQRATELQFFSPCAAVYYLGIKLACERVEGWMAVFEGKGR